MLRQRPQAIGKCCADIDVGAGRRTCLAACSRSAPTTLLTTSARQGCRLEEILTQGTEKGWSICTDAPTPSPTSPISVVGISGFPLGRKVQAVDDDGNGVSLTSDVFNAIKPEEVGSLVRFDFSAESSAKLRFSFGRDSDCSRTLIEMLFLTVTLLDSDCGVDRPQCEEVTSTDHSSFEGGQNVTVTEHDDYVSFENKRGLIFNAENNPADVVLTDQHRILRRATQRHT